MWHVPFSVGHLQMWHVPFSLQQGNHWLTAQSNDVMRLICARSGSERCGGCERQWCPVCPNSFRYNAGIAFQRRGLRLSS